MGFDKSFLLGNLVMIVVLIYIWYPLVSLWIIIPIALVLAVLSIDPFAGQYLCLLILIILMCLGISLREKRGSEPDTKPEPENTLSNLSNTSSSRTSDHSIAPGVFIN